MSFLQDLVAKNRRQNLPRTCEVKHFGGPLIYSYLLIPGAGSRRVSEHCNWSFFPKTTTAASAAAAKATTVSIAADYFISLILRKTEESHFLRLLVSVRTGKRRGGEGWSFDDLSYVSHICLSFLFPFFITNFYPFCSFCFDDDTFWLGETICFFLFLSFFSSVYHLRPTFYSFSFSTFIFLANFQREVLI